MDTAKFYEGQRFYCDEFDKCFTVLGPPNEKGEVRVRVDKENGARTVSLKGPWLSNCSELDGNGKPIRRFKKSEHTKNFSGEDEYFRTLGYLAKHGKMEAEVPEKDTIRFERNFERIKAERPSVGNHYRILIDKTNKFGPQIRIFFPESNLREIFVPPGINNKRNQNLDKQTSCNVSDNQWCWELLEMGFNLGKEHDIERVISNIPNEHKESFYVGYTEGEKEK